MDAIEFPVETGAHASLVRVVPISWIRLEDEGAALVSIRRELEKQDETEATA